jgi:hypothetical protein
MLDWLTSRLRFARNHREWRRIAAKLVDSKTERASLWKVLNQSFILWALSAVVIGAWSTLHATSQQSHEQADKIYNDLVPPLNELSWRFREINKLSHDKDHDGDVDKIFRGESGFQLPAYKDQSLVTVLELYNSAARHIAAKNFPQVRAVAVCSKASHL